MRSNVMCLKISLAFLVGLFVSTIFAEDSYAQRRGGGQRKGKSVAKSSGNRSAGNARRAGGNSRRTGGNTNSKRMGNSRSGTRTQRATNQKRLGNSKRGGNTQRGRNIQRARNMQRGANRQRGNGRTQKLTQPGFTPGRGPDLRPGQTNPGTIEPGGTRPVDANQIKPGDRPSFNPNQGRPDIKPAGTRPVDVNQIKPGDRPSFNPNEGRPDIKPGGTRPVDVNQIKPGDRPSFNPNEGRPDIKPGGTRPVDLNPNQDKPEVTPGGTRPIDLDQKPWEHDIPGLNVPGQNDPGQDVPGQNNPGQNNPGPTNGGHTNNQHTNHAHGQHHHHHWKFRQKFKCWTGTYRNCSTRCNYVRRNVHLHWNFNVWRGHFPARCHWWYDWCGTNHYFDPTCSINADWTYFPIQVVENGVTQQYSWYLGVHCLFIPGRGIGIQEVEPGSPAELAGLTPGMVILQADGIGLTNDDVMSSIIEGSDGLLNLTVISDADENLFDVEVQMEQIVENDF